MSSLHPLELPEIISHTAEFVQKRFLPSCSLVSKAWHKVFNRIIWQEIVLSATRLDPPEAIQSHIHLVKRFKLVCFETGQEHARLRFPNLVSLDLHVSRYSQDITELILGHPSLTRLRVAILKPEPKSRFWEKLLGFHNLRDLTLSNIALAGKDVDTFWQLCTQLEQLDLTWVSLSPQGNILSMEFLHIKEVSLRGFTLGETPLFLEFMRRCPGLSSLALFTYFGDDDTQFISGFISLVAGRTWPNLHKIAMMVQSMTIDEISTITQGMQRITHLTLESSMEWFSLDILEQLRPQFCNFRKLKIETGLDISSTVAQEVLSSCPLLESYEGYGIDAIDIVKGKPWVCLGLKVLRLYFCFGAATISHLQPKVLDQVSRLTRLEELHMKGFNGGGGLESMDLTLENGLGKLSTLRLLRIFNFSGTKQRMGEQEIDWMLEHWKCLEQLQGYLNYKKSDVTNELRRRLEDHDIAVF